ncbi:tetratricopeptide repeat protein [Psychroserpens sp. AS72]|uniref:tetratricopeptide repeat protein n=1 Tax=Psychroserpens sp. AS72 TaxID=3135775 RepID=UPI003176E509
MDIERFHLLNHLWKETINNNIADAVTYSESMIELGQALKIDTILSFGLERKATAYAYMNNFDSSGVYFRKALKMYDLKNDYNKKASVLRNLGQDHNILGNLDSAFYYYELSGKNYKLDNDIEGVADIYNSKAVVYLQKGYYNLALENATKSEKMYSDLNLDKDLNQNRMVIASTYASMKDTLNAIDYYKKIIEYFKSQNQKRQLCVSMTILAGLQISNQSLNSETEKLISESIAISEELKAPSLIDNAYTKYGNFLYKNGDFEKAKQVQLKIIADEIKREEYFTLTISKTDLGRSLIALKYYSQAINHLNEAKALAEKYDIISALPPINKLLSESYLEIGNYEKSLAYFKDYKIEEDKVNGKESQNRFSELQTIYETEKKEAEIALQEEEIKTLNAQAENDKLTKTLYGIGMFSFLAIASLLYFSFKQRLKKNRIEREKQEEIYKQEIAFKKKELTSQTLHLVQKNTFIQELKENLEKIKQSPELFKVEFRRLVMLLKKESAEDKDWEVFKSYFSEVHNDFDNKIKSIANDITEKEIRLASFLRMNLSTKEIASMINVLPDSVLKSKYRLKKKLQLDKEEDLTQFLNTL